VMSEILRTRRISPLTRKASSVSYKINTEAVAINDTLRVEITHALKPGKWVYIFNGNQIADKKSIHFRVKEVGEKIIITWGVLDAPKKVEKQIKKTVSASSRTNMNLTGSNFVSSEQIKKSFLPVIDNKTRILILGSLPGDESLKRQQYYANPRNQFWKIIFSVLDQELPSSYEERLSLLLKNKIGLWDVCHSANRKGSLDQYIKNEVPNDVHGLLKKYPLLKTVLFNGAKAKATFDKHFVQHNHVRYDILLSSSGAATISMTKKVIQWKMLILNQKEVGNG